MLKLILFCFVATAAYGDEDWEIMNFEGETFILDTLLKEFGKQNLILSLGKGTAIPLKISVSGSVFKLDGASNLALRLSRTIYLKFCDDEILVSADKKNWDQFNDFLDGEIKMQIDTDAKKMPVIKIAADINLKEK